MSNLMLKRKLNSINYPEVASFDINDEFCFKNLICWLEDQKIRHYKIEDRKPLRDLNSANWNDALEQFLNDISCPYNSKDYVLIADWCLTFALRLEFEDNLNFNKQELANKLSRNRSTNKKINPLDCLEFDSDEFREGIKLLASNLKIPVHMDNLTTLKAILIYIQNRLNEDPQLDDEKRKSSIFELDQIPLGFEVENKELKDALKLLRLLYINNLRNLQNNINHILVEVQSLTADPKTDSTLGKVGR